MPTLVNETHRAEVGLGAARRCAWAPAEPMVSTDQTTRFSSWLSRYFTSLNPSPGTAPA